MNKPLSRLALIALLGITACTTRAQVRFTTAPLPPTPLSAGATLTPDCNADAVMAWHDRVLGAESAGEHALLHVNEFATVPDLLTPEQLLRILILYNTEAQSLVSLLADGLVPDCAKEYHRALASLLFDSSNALIEYSLGRSQRASTYADLARSHSEELEAQYHYIQDQMQPTATPPPPLITRTGIPYVDAVIEAVESGDPQALTSLFVLRTVPCTPEKWLMSQPLCPQGISDGTPIQAMPMLGLGDTGYLTTDEIDSWQGIGEVQLYAVYRTGPYTYSHEFFPSGEYAVAFIPKEGHSGYARIFQVTQGGIVRIDCGGLTRDDPGCYGSTIEEILHDHESEFILGPYPQLEWWP